MTNRKIEQKKLKQVVIDEGLHHMLKQKAAESRRTIRELVEAALSELLAVET